MAYKERGSKGLLFGMALGGALVGVAAYLVTSKNGRKLQQELMKGYEEASHQVEHCIGSLKEKMQTTVTKKMEDISEKTTEMLTDFADVESKDFKQGILVGGIVGVVLSIGCTMVFKASLEEENGFEHFGSQLVQWKNILKEVMDTFGKTTSKIHPFPSDQSHTLDELVDFAATGMKLWKKVKG